MKQRILLAVSLSLTGLLPKARAQTPDLYDIQTIRDVYLTFNQTNWWQQLVNNYAPEINIPADLRVDNVTLPNVGVRFRGNTSYTQLPAGSEKKSFNIETDVFVPGQDLWGYEHLNLNNGFHDPTFLREFLTYWTMRQWGPAPLCNFVRLHLNGVYWGIYINVQQPNKDMMRLFFRSNDGNRYRGFPTSGGFMNGRCALTWLGATPSLYLAAYQAKQGDGVDLMNLCNVLNNTPVAQLQALLPASFSVDQFYRYAAVMNVATNTDSYLQSGKDHFLYRDPIHGDFHMFPFDVNEAMVGSATLDPWANTTNAQRPAFTKTLQFNDWRERYKAHVRTIVEQTFNATLLDPMVRQFHAMLQPHVLADTKKIYPSQQFLDNLTMTVTIQNGFGSATLPGLLPFITNRAAYLRGRPDLSAPRATLSALQHTPSNPNPSQTVTVTVTASGLASQVKLWWRRVGPFQSTAMFDDGQHGDGGAGDGVWGASIAPQVPGSLVDYYAEALTGSLATYLPATGEYNANGYRVAWPTGTSPIRLNEFLAQNVNGIVDENNQHEDWLELYNDSNQTVNVGGMWLTDDLARTKFQIPAGTSIPANGTLLVWCDEDGGQGPLHANFKLSANGEALGLFAADGVTLLDAFEFGLQTTDVSTGRVLDGSLPWATFPAPSPRVRNQGGGCGTILYAALDRTMNGVSLSLNGSPQIGASPSLSIARGPASGVAGLMLALLPAHIDMAAFSLPNEVFLLSPVPFLVGPVYLNLDPQGAVAAPFAIPPDPNLVGAAIYTQAFAVGASGFDTSNALVMVLCP